MRSTRFVSGLLLAIALGLPAIAQSDAGSPECWVLDIHQIGPARLAALSKAPGLEWWLELDDEWLACGSETALAPLERLARVKRSLGVVATDRLRLAYKTSRVELERRGLRILAAGGLFAVVEISETLAPDLDPLELQAFRPKLVLARQLANQPARAQPATGDSRVARLVAAIDLGRWFRDVERLAGYNRYSLGGEITRARKWLKRQFRRLQGMEVTNHFFSIDGTRVGNIVATLPGRSRPKDWLIVGAHYDSTSDDPFTSAPGAEDNATGCAGVLEMARIFAADPPEATMIFVCYAGEEQGLFGSIDHVTRLQAGGDAERVGAMFNLDMIGFTEDADLDSLLQAAPRDQFLIDALTDSAARHTELRLVTSNELGGSDHVPYATVAIPAVLSIENDWSVYPHYHRTTDTPEQITPEMAGEILRMNVGAIARFSGNSDIAGCVELEGSPLVGVDVTSTQAGEPRRRSTSDRHGCFAVDPVARGESFRLRIKGRDSGPGEPSVSGCVLLLGEPARARRVILRQPGERVQKTRSNDDGCFAFDAAAGKRFNLIFKGPVVPAV